MAAMALKVSPSAASLLVAHHSTGLNEVPTVCLDQMHSTELTANGPVEKEALGILC